MSKNLTLDIGSSSCKLCLTEKKFNSIEILFYAEKKYANPVRDNLSDEMIEVISNQLKNLIRDFNDVDKEIKQRRLEEIINLQQKHSKERKI